MRVAQVVQRYGPDVIGGCETHVRRVSEALASKGIEVHVFTSTARTMEAMAMPHVAPGPRFFKPGSVEENGVRVHRFRGLLSSPSPSQFAAYIRGRGGAGARLPAHGRTPHPPGLVKALRAREKEFGLVNAHSEQFTSVLARKATSARPFVWTGHLHVEMFDESPAPTRRRLEALARGADYFVPMTEHDAAYFRNRFGSRVLSPVGNGIDPEQFRDERMPPAPPLIKEGKRYVAFVGRSHPDKGFLEGARAVASLGPGYEDVRYLHIGPVDGRGLRAYDRLGEDVKKRVVIASQVPDSQKLAMLRRCSALTLFSRYESFGIVLLEAWMLGVPVVVSDRGALPTLVGSDGVVARFGDVAAYADGIRRCLDEEEWARDAACRGRERVLRDFTWEAVAKRSLGNFERVTGGR